MPPLIPSYEDLQAEVAQLRAELYAEADAILESRVCRALKLTPQEARLALLMLSRRGDVVRKVTMFTALWSRDQPEEKILDVLVCKLRGKGVDIWTDWGRGWGLTPAGVDTVAEAASVGKEDGVLGFLAEPRVLADVAEYLGATRMSAVATLRHLHARGLVARGLGGEWRATSKASSAP